MTILNEDMMIQRRDALSTFLGRVAGHLDMPEELQQLADDEYDSLANFVKTENEKSDTVDSELYPQGSRRLGTVTRPVSEADDYDFDLVYRRDLAKTSTTQQQLKDDVGEQLRRFVKHKKAIGSHVPELTEGRRCWTLDYTFESHADVQFHMDVLPAIPNEEGLENSILITDKELVRWQHSNPKDYAKWFFSRMVMQLNEQRSFAAKEADVKIEDVPEWRVKTTLQRAIQILKRHRDSRFEGNPEDKPISIIITTLAAKAYREEADLYSAMIGIVRGMRDHVELRDEIYWVPNPINPDENFADKWKDHPERADEFFKWLDQVELDLTTMMEKRGIDEVAGVLAPTLGKSLINAALDTGREIRQQREGGTLKAAIRTGILGSTGIAVRPHTFFGDVE